MLPDAVACGASTTSAVRDGEGWSSIDTAPAFSMPTEPTPVSEATTQPARPTVPHKAVVTCANRRGFMIPSPPPESQACDAADLRIKIGACNDENCRSSIFPESV